MVISGCEMTQRIRELAEQVYGTQATEQEIKLAELIVEECVKVAHPKLTDVGEWAAGMRLVQQRLKQHFGVEE